MDYYKNLDLSDIKYFCEFDLVWKIEQWKDVVGLEGSYMVSDLGRVKGLDRTCHHRYGGVSKLKSKIKKPSFDKDYYLFVGLQKDLKKKNFRCHQLVSTAFIPNPFNKDTVNHKNGIKTDNYKLNLEWNTRLENNIHAIETGLNIIRRGEDAKNSILTEKDVRYIKDNLNLIKIAQLSKMFNITRGAIYNIKNNLNWKHVV
jgi:hypothetical protein